MIVEIKIPEISENVTSGTVVSVHVQVGDPVGVDDILIELETDKAVVEIPSTDEGVVTELLVSEGDEKNVGDVIAKIDTDASASAEAAAPEEAVDADEADAPDDTDAPEETEGSDAAGPSDEIDDTDREDDADQPSAQAATPSDSPATSAAPDRPPEQAAQADAPDSGPSPPAAPSVRRLARELGVDLSQVPPSGPGGHLTAGDVKVYAKAGRKSGPDDKKAPSAVRAAAEMPDFSAWGDVETVDLSGIRKITAANMAQAWRTVPHVTQFDEADVTEVERFVREKAALVEKKGGKLTLTAVLIKILASALQRYPYFNASIDPDAGKVILKQYIHMGVAVATEHGLLVPVVRDADRKSISQIATEVVVLAGRARSRKIQPNELEGATFTISNQGGIGGNAFTPIVAWPQVAILGVSRTALRQRPVSDGDSFAPRRVLPLALSYDHRLIDGADAARFLRWVCEALEAPLTLFLDAE